MTLGEGSFLNESVYLDASDVIVVEELAQIGDHVRFITSTHDISPDGARIAGASRTSPIRVGSGAWIGSGATVLPGVNVGSHAILGAGAVAVRDLEPYGVYVGVPARLARMMKPTST
ncbi:acyltransferase [Microbacterium testaceum]|uniref:acyltransferase n=1 Tax=Microbacterium testaceum TaxID=2033 RepID=UPI0025AF5888|nr:acyltransferase [Microbacterium testaceum]WJS89636.1 acyltransferase [Microbacterium testaceum]